MVLPSHRSAHSLAPELRPAPLVRRCAFLLAVALLALPGVAGAQVVRGTVVERTTDASLAGVIVELAPAAAGAGRVASALSDPSGAFALRAPAAGRYVVTAKRIGVRRYVSAPLDLAEGETKSLRVVLEALDYRLPEVVVVANTLCSTDPAESARVAALWEEARSALDAAQISLRDRLFSAEVTRYVRELDPKSKRVLNETRSETRGVVASPFQSAPPESLSARGYWTSEPSGGAIYHGPDAEVLLSDSFLRDHCFRVVKGDKQRSSLTGLAFSPVAGRPVPDINGTLWLDARSFELRLVDFKYDRVREGVDGDALGGEVHFTRLSNGAWIVRKWFIRVPVMGRPTQPLSTEGSAPWVLVRPSTFRLAEEGGLVTTDEQRPPARPATIEGVVRDSSGKRPLPGAVVRLGGSSRTATPDAAGRFTFAQLPPGNYTVVAEAAGYDSLGLVAADASVSLGDGETRRVALEGHDTRALTTRLCRGAAAPFGRGTLYVTVRDSSTRSPVPGVPVSVRWMSTIGAAPGDSVARTVDGVTGAKGSVTFCEIAAERELTVLVARPGSTPAPARKLNIRPREVRRVDVGIAP